LDWEQVLKWLLIALATSPMWGTLIWVIWEGSIKPRIIPKAEIVALATSQIESYGANAAEMTSIQEDRAWRYSESFEQGKWKRVRQEIDRLSGEA
jgi:hypothetical protein